MALVAAKYILTTAVGALTAAVLAANMRWFSGSNPRYDFELLKKARLLRLDGSNEQISGQDLWKDKGAVIMAVRRPG